MFTNITLYRYINEVKFTPDDYQDTINYAETVKYRLHKRGRGMLLYISNGVGPELHRVVRITNRYLPILAEELIGEEDNNWLEQVRIGILRNHTVPVIGI